MNPLAPLHTLALTALLALAACGKPKHVVNASDTIEVTDGYLALEKQREGWLDELKSREEAYGWPSARDCDGLLWAGLAAHAGHSLDLSSAELAPGRMIRRPDDDCYPVGQSSSSISRDMLLGYMLGLLKHRDAEAAERLFSYGSGNGWMMGVPEGMFSATYFNPNMQRLLARLIKALGGPEHPQAKGDPWYFDVKKDYERHLQVLSIHLFGEITMEEGKGYITDPMLGKLKGHVNAEPKDALFQAVLGQYTARNQTALELLADPGYVCPTYVRGHDNYCLVHKLMAASVILD